MIGMDGHPLDQSGFSILELRYMGKITDSLDTF